MVFKKKNVSVDEDFVTPEKTETAKVVSDEVLVASKFQHSVVFNVPDNNGNMQPVTIKGNAEHLRGLEMGVLPTDAWALTKVPAKAWSYIQSHYKDMLIIKNGIIFRSSGMAEASERHEVKSGYEPVDTTKTKTKEADK